MMSYRKILLAGACASACLIGGGAIATAGDDPSPAPASEVQDADAAPVQSVPPDQAEDLRQLRRPRTSDDALPAQWRDELATGDDSDENWGANPSLSRRT